MKFSESIGIVEEKVYLIHDRSPELCFHYEDYGLLDVTTSVKAPNMNAIADRFVGSVRREVLDACVVYEVQTKGKIVSIPLLSGSHHHYERHSA